MASTMFLSLALAVCAAATALPLTEDAATASGFLSFPITHRRATVPLAKRDDTSVPLFNLSVISYSIAMSIGTPGQEVQVAIDTGSDELWVNPQCSTVSDSQQRADCSADGKYRPSSSNTSAQSSQTNKIAYGKGEATIQYFRDSISLPDSTISLKEVIFGVATSSKDLSQGILGLGYGNGVNLKYNNFVDTLAEQNVTRSRAFSIALGSVDANNGGVIIFGGVDTKKYSGSLAQVPILGPQGGETVRRYWVQLDSIGVTKQSSSGGNNSSKTYTGSSTPIVLDSGSSLSYLPSAVVSQMASDSGATWSQTAQVYLVPCSQVSTAATFDFSFGGGAVRISVPWRQFIWQAGEDQCVLGALPLQQDSGISALLGDSFLRSAYVVFDQTSDALFLAQYANCGQAERAIPAQPAGAVTGFAGECEPGAGVAATGNNKSVAATHGGPMGLWVGAVAALLAHMLFGLL